MVTFNVWFRNRDLKPVAMYLERSAADAVVLLELDPHRALELREMLPSYSFSHIGTEPHGAVIFSRWPLLEQRSEPLCERCVSLARVRLDWRGHQIDLLGAHLHWPLGAVASRLRAAELAALARLVRSSAKVTLLGGDFNLTPWSRYFAEFISDSGLADCARRQGWLPTWPRSTALLGIRIDHCFASAQWRTVQVSVGPPLGSDHLPNVIDLRLTNAGPSSRLGRYADCRYRMRARHGSECARRSPAPGSGHSSRTMRLMM